jgi:hypothetical protein
MDQEDHSLQASMVQAPDDMAQIPRELTMLRGAVSSLHGAANDLLGRLTPAVRDVPEEEASELRKVPTNFPVSTEMSRTLRDISDEVSAIENKLARAAYRIEL